MKLKHIFCLWKQRNQKHKKNKKIQRVKDLTRERERDSEFVVSRERERNPNLESCEGV